MKSVSQTIKIMDLMCQGDVSMETIEQAHGIQFRDYFEQELKQLQEFEAEEMLTVSPSRIQITPKGRFFLRGIAMVFTAHRHFRH